jgi:bisphosphoglycerate-dependent phosphoglycerate mutase
MKNTVFWDVAPCRYYVNRRFGGTYRVHLQGRSNSGALNQLEQIAVYSYLLTLVYRSWIASTLKVEAIRSSETSVNKIPTRRHIPEDGILQGQNYSVELLVMSRYMLSLK